MTQGLREVAEHLIGFGVVLLRHEPQLVRGRDRAVVGGAGLLRPSLTSQALDEPEAARHEGTLFRVVAVVNRVAAQQAVPVELFTNRVGGPDHPLVVVGHEVDAGQPKDGGIQVLGVERLHEDAALAVVAAPLHGLPHLLTGLLPAALGSFSHAVLGQLQTAVDRCPAQDLGMDEVPGLRAPLPDSSVRVLPMLDCGLHEVDEEAPVVVVGLVPALVPAPALVEELPVCVELELSSGGIADPDRLGAAVALQVVELELGQAPLAPDAEQDLRSLALPAALRSMKRRNPSASSSYPRRAIVRTARVESRIHVYR